MFAHGTQILDGDIYLTGNRFTDGSTDLGKSNRSPKRRLRQRMTTGVAQHETRANCRIGISRQHRRWRIEGRRHNGSPCLASRKRFRLKRLELTQIMHKQLESIGSL